MLSLECWVHASCAREVGSLVWAMDDNLDRALRASKRLWALRRALTAGRSGRSHSCRQRFCREAAGVCLLGAVCCTRRIALSPQAAGAR
jgi:hypothetical protein